MSNQPAEAVSQPDRSGFLSECRSVWKRLPYKGLFLSLLVAWVALFHFLGNSTLGYVNSPSLFLWLHNAYINGVNDEHGHLIPIVILVLLWFKREELLQLPIRHCWPALALVVVGILLHLAGYVVQQTRLSAVGFCLGLYGMIGLIWGAAWLKATFFPLFLFVFCIPLGNLVDEVSFPLRLMATKITYFVCKGILGLNIVQVGTQLLDPSGKYHYEVAVACSGLRSIIAISAISTIYAFCSFRSLWRRGVILGLAVPLAVVSNVVRLFSIVLAAEVFGQDAGNYVHESGFFSMLPYLPSFLGLYLVGRWLSEKPPATAPLNTPKNADPLPA